MQTLRNASIVLPSFNIRSWNALISSHVKNRNAAKAVELYHDMLQQGFAPDKGTYLSVLKALSIIKDLQHARTVHKHIVNSRLESDVVVGSSLVHMYAQCGDIATARASFDKIENPNVVCWGSMIEAYAECGLGQLSFQFFDRMVDEGVHPDRVTFLSLLKACCTLKNTRLVHNEILFCKLETEISIGSNLVALYSKYGSLDESERILNQLPFCNVVTWSSLISGYANHGHDEKSLKLFERMQNNGVLPGRVAFLSLIRSCVNLGAISEGMIIHDHIMKASSDIDVNLGNALIDMYGKCSYVHEARSVFDSLPIKTIVSYGALMMCYAENGVGYCTLELYKEMQRRKIKPDRAIFIAIFKACGSIQDLEQGKLVHYELIGSGLELDVSVVTAVIEMYIKCDSLGEAWEQFKCVPRRDEALWNIMLNGFLGRGHTQLVFQLFKEMQLEGIKPDGSLFVCALTTCASMEALMEGRLIHKQIVSCISCLDSFLTTSLIDMYAKCGSIEDANKVFNQSPNRSTVHWSAMIAGCVYCSQGFLALDFYCKMLEEGLNPVLTTFTSALNACSSVGALEQGRLIHAQVIEEGLQSDTIVGNTIVDLYGKCYRLEDAEKVFDSMLMHDVVSWSALLGGYAILGDYKLATQCLNVMHNEGLKPDRVMFTSILSAFSHSGLTEEGHHCLEAMTKDFGIRPGVEHYNCVIDLLARSGFLKEALVFLKGMPASPNLISWISLLTNCNTHGDTYIGNICFEEIVRLDPDHASSYVILSDLYTDGEKWADLKTIQEMKMCAAAWKVPGKAWIEVNYKTYEFFVGEGKHPLSCEMHSKLNRIRRISIEDGSVPQLSLIKMLET